MRTHFATGPVTTACGIGKRTTTNWTRVDCLNCKKKPEYERAEFAAKEAKLAAFNAQEPHTVRNPWTQQNLVCHVCGGDQFKDLDRDLWTYWFYCVGCTKNQGYPTETGMCQ